MANPFAKIMAVAKQKADEQRWREERLKQLEEAEKRPGFHFPNPLQSMKDKKEMNELRKAIAAYKENQRRNRILIGIGCFLLVMFIFIGIMIAIENAAENESSTDTGMYPEIPTSSETEDSVGDITDDDTTEGSTVESTTRIDSASEPTTNTTTSTENTETMAAWDGLVLEVSDLSVKTLTDYAHTDTEVIFLGNDEGVTITISTSVVDMTTDDLVIIYDDSLLSVKVSEPVRSGSRTVIELYVTGKTSCETEMAICTTYDVEMQGDEATGYLLDIRKLNATEGRVVYVTSSGDKYHFSESCAGGYSTKTTYRDAKVYEYDPCGKCAD